MDTPSIRSDWVGRVIDRRFVLLEWLGGSGCSGAFLSELPDDRTQKVVIKLISDDAAGAEARIANWAATATLSHTHLMPLFHTGRFQIDDVKLLYAVTEYAEEVLSQILLERPLTPTEAREMLDPVLETLDYLHGNGFVHGHIKPSNIMVVENQLKLSGDCIHVAGELRKDSPESAVYDAPERATETISAAADIWSLGMTLVEVLTQHPPAWDISTNAEPVLPESTPQPFAAIAQQCLSLEPAHRCNISDIKAYLEPAKTRSDSASESSKAMPAKSRVWAIGAAVLVLITIVAIALWRSQRVDPSFSNGKQPLVMKLPAPSTESPTPTTQAAKGAVVKGEVAERIVPEVLPSASASITGTVNVEIRVMVDSSGEVSNATFERPGPSKYFAKVALQAAQRWRFKPAQLDGRAASSVWVLQFQFKRSTTEVTPIEASP